MFSSCAFRARLRNREQDISEAQARCQTISYKTESTVGRCELKYYKKAPTVMIYKKDKDSNTRPSAIMYCSYHA